jgi:hypothetical protein
MTLVSLRDIEIVLSLLDGDRVVRHEHALFMASVPSHVNMTFHRLSHTFFVPKYALHRFIDPVPNTHTIARWVQVLRLYPDVYPQCVLDAPQLQAFRQLRARYHERMNEWEELCDHCCQIS